jgi:uncharacterized protein YjbI with pentapeptide repeats
MVTRVTTNEPRPPDLDESSLEPLGAPLDHELDVYRSRISGEHAGLRGSGEVAESLLDGASMADSRLDPLTLTDVRIRRGDLSNAVWEHLTARRVAVEGCRSVGWRVIVDFAEDLLVEGCRWDHGGIFVTRTRGAVVFRDCTFAGTTLRGDLSRVWFDSCDLAGAEFNASGAAGCDLRTSRLAGAGGLLTLRGARIGSDQLFDIAGLLAVEAGFELA